MKRNTSFNILLISLLTMFTSCDVVKQVSQMSNLAKCEFRIESVEQLRLAGVDVQNIKSLSDLSMLDAGRIASAAMSPQFPLDFMLNIAVKNPNAVNAGMTRLEWILLIDDQEMTRGILDKQITIPANNGSADIPMQMHIDLKKALTGKSADAVINFGMNLAGSGNSPTRFTLKLKPTINVGGIPVAYPGYVNVKTEYTSN